MNNIAHLMMKAAHSNPYRTPIAMINYVDLDNLPTSYDEALYGYLHHAVSTKDLHFLMSSVSIVTEFLDHCTVNVSSPSLRNNRQHLCNTAYLLLFNIADFSKVSDYDKSSQLATVINVYKRLNSLKDLNAPH